MLRRGASAATLDAAPAGDRRVIPVQVRRRAGDRSVKAPEHIETPRLLLRRPRATDASAIFERFASDREVTRFVGWPAHASVDDARAFVEFSDAEWLRWPAGPYLVISRSDETLLGSTGLAFETPYRASTGYVLARDAWGRGYATEALRAMVELARRTRVVRLYAICHVDHQASAHVLEKGGFTREATLGRFIEFPNLLPGDPCDVLCYAMIFDRR
jgi:RimJ/RimL family protein N-acetyltransferase